MIAGIEGEDMLAIDYEKILIQELIITKQEDSEYQLWKERVERAKSKKRKGLMFIITGAGAAAVGGALVLSSRTSGPEIPGPYFFPSEYSVFLSVKQRHYYEWKWYSAALLGGGGALAVWGLFVYESGDEMKKGLEEEGKSKGYLTLNLNPQFNQVNIAYKIEF